MADLLNPETHVDRKIHRFLHVAAPRPDSRGWYDPGNLEDDAGQAYLVHTLQSVTTPNNKMARPPAGILAAYPEEIAELACKHDGWTPAVRRDYLLYLANACKTVRPD